MSHKVKLSAGSINACKKKPDELPIRSQMISQLVHAREKAQKEHQKNMIMDDFEKWLHKEGNASYIAEITTTGALSERSFGFRKAMERTLEKYRAFKGKECR